MTALPGSFIGSELTAHTMNELLTRNRGPAEEVPQNCCVSVETSPGAHGAYIATLYDWSGPFTEINDEYRLITTADNVFDLTSGRKLHIRFHYNPVAWGWSIEVEMLEADDSTPVARVVGLAAKSIHLHNTESYDDCFYLMTVQGSSGDPLMCSPFGDTWIPDAGNNFVDGDQGFVKLDVAPECAHLPPSLDKIICEYPSRIGVQGANFVDLHNDTMNWDPMEDLEFCWALCAFKLGADAPRCNADCCSEDGVEYWYTRFGSAVLKMTDLNGITVLDRIGLYAWQKDPWVEPGYYEDTGSTGLCNRYIWHESVWHPGLRLDLVLSKCPGRPFRVALTILWSQPSESPDGDYTYCGPLLIGFPDLEAFYRDCPLPEGSPYACLPGYYGFWNGGGSIYVTRASSGPLLGPFPSTSTIYDLMGYGLIWDFQYVGIAEDDDGPCLDCHHEDVSLTESKKINWTNCDDPLRISFGPMAMFTVTMGF